MDIISRAKAKAAGLKRYFTGKPCKRGHLAQRYVSVGECLECDYLLEIANRRPLKKHPNKKAFHRAMRRIRKINATPIWANKKKIDEIYESCRRIAKETGVPHHVDHVIPLKHPKVCGLHVELNLQPIPAINNMKKHNNFLSC